MRRKKLAGFTLVELLVAMAIFSVIAVISLRGVGSSLENRAHLEQESRKWRDLTALLVTLEADLASAIGGSGLPFFGAASSAGSDEAWMAFSRAGRDSNSGAALPPRGVIYRLTGDSVERSTSYLTDVTLRPPTTPLGVSRFPVPLRAVTLRYLADAGEWRDRWTDPSAGLPRAVEISLDLATERVSRVFALQ